MESKTCSKCNVNKLLSEFPFRKYSGKYRSICKDCEKEYHKQYRNLNRETRNSYNREYSKLNKESIREKHKIYQKSKKESDPLFKLTKNVRSLIRTAFTNKGKRKNSKTEKNIGCSFAEFKIHIESLWEPWMNWDNYGRYIIGGIRTWNIDHIIPLDSAVTESEIIKLNHYTNLRPLCSKENRYKSNKF